MNIKERKEALNQIIADASKLLVELRAECSHPVGRYTYKSSGDFHDDKEYWKTMLCTDCGRSWMIDSVDANGVRNDEYYTNPTDQWVRNE